MEAVKAYRPKSGGFSTSQILPCAYGFEKARLVLKEMVDGMAMSLVGKNLSAGSIGVYIGYDSQWPETYKGPLVQDYYGRLLPQGSHGSAKLKEATASSQVLTKAAVAVFDDIVDKGLYVKRIGISVDCDDKAFKVQPSLFDESRSASDADSSASEDVEASKERRQLEVALELKKRFGKNVILRGMDLEDGATAKERNGQIGGHNA